MKAERHSHLSLPLSSRLPASSGGLIMTPIAELLLQGGSRRLALHLEVSRLDWVEGSQAEPRGAEPIVHKDETLSYLIYSSIELRILPARNQADSSRWRRPCVHSYANFQTSAFCSSGLRFACVLLSASSFLGPLHSWSFKLLNAALKRCRNMMQILILWHCFKIHSFQWRLIISFVLLMPTPRTYQTLSNWPPLLWMVSAEFNHSNARAVYTPLWSQWPLLPNVLICWCPVWLLDDASEENWNHSRNCQAGK